MEKFDMIVIGAGLYGLYSANYCGQKGKHILVLECDDAPFKRATYINQARVHMGYHYPRSISTAIKTAGYFDRFNKDFSFCLNRQFDQIYATSSKYSWTDRNQFKEFCRAANIPCEELHPERYFKKDMCDGAFLTKEYTYDAMILLDYFLDQLTGRNNVTLQYGVMIQSICQTADSYVVALDDGREFETGFLLNATYAGSNQIMKKLGYETFGIKYELCEIILCDVNSNLKNIGFTVMDGPFFSIMPFGKTGYHSLTAVTFTPHTTSFSAVPDFSCMEKSEGRCTPEHLGNCNDCPQKPKTAYPYMAKLARKYMREEYGFTYRKSLFSMKPILKSSEIDDSRPTVVRVCSTKPTFISVLSGKINTVYDLDEVLED
ncbi:MAG: FAD-dependent oxidoreductase [Oscillospiraceae bacterium]